MTELKPPVSFRFSPGERQTPVWEKLKSYAESKIADARLKNDSVSNTESETAALRGEIRAYKALLDLGKDLPTFEQT